MSDQLQDGSFMFTSESVGEGHPGESAGFFLSIQSEENWKHISAGCVVTLQAWWVCHSEHMFSVTYSHAWAAGSDCVCVCGGG